MKRRVAYVTGTRADYGLFSEALKRIRENPELELGVIVTGMHLEPQFGMTVSEVEADGMPIVARVPNLEAGDTGAAQAHSVGRALLGITDALVEFQPEVLLVLGDRGEMLAGATAAVHLEIAVGHVHGGEVSGTVDELVRHAITKLSHVHFTATQDAAQRVTRMGERSENVHVVGAAGLDYMRRFEPIPDAQISQEVGFDVTRPFVIFTQHPVTGEVADAAPQMQASLRALEKTRLQVVASYPNSDAGGRSMLEVLEAWHGDRLHVFPSLGQRKFATLLKKTKAMVGNSSSGIIEAPFFGVPAVNIGTRQAGRLRAGNVVDVGYDSEAIREAIDCAVNDEEFRARVMEAPSPYGDGHAGERIVEVLGSLQLGRELLNKQITY